MAGTYKVQSDARPVLNALARLRGLLTDLRPAFTPAVQELNRRSRFRFQFKRDPDNRPWKPWAASTRERREAEGRGATLMLNTRRLRDNSRYIAGQRDIRAVIGTRYGIYHEQPARDGTRLPRRAFLFSMRNGRRGLGPTDEQMVLSKLRYQVRKAAKV
jgi:hypothetical protein